jgi:hypothetical protein
MAAKVQLNNFRFSIYIDADGTVTLTDLPPELREVAQALDPTPKWGAPSAISAVQGAAPPTEDRSACQIVSDGLGRGTPVTDSCRRMA